MYVVVINRDEDHDRLLHFQSTMDRLDVPFHRWSATPGTELDDTRFDLEPIGHGIYIKDFRQWSKNEAACGVSHIKVLQHIVRERIPWAIVMEDDAVLQRPLPLDSASWELPEDADIVLLNDRAAPGAVRKAGVPFSYADVSGGAGTEGYLVSMRGAEKLLKVLYPLREPLDFQMYAHFASIQTLDTPPYYWSLPRNPEAADVVLQAYRVVPSLVMHADEASSIGNQRHPRAHYYCKVLLGLDFDSDQSHDSPGVNSLGSYSLMSTFAPAKTPMVTRPTPTPGKIMWRGVDISHFDETTQFSDTSSDGPRDLMAVLRYNGVNSVRISLWVGSDTIFNLGRILRLAKRAHLHGLQVCLVLHYSDTWADPRRQVKPRDWRSLPMSELAKQMYKYTRAVVEAMCTQGSPPAIVQIGNEITNGMLWATDIQHFADGGRLSRPMEEGCPLPWEGQWHVFAELLRQAIKGARDGMLPFGSQARIMLHMHKGADSEAAATWFAKAIEHAIDFDVMGLSFYSLWHAGATLANLRQLGVLARAFPDKEIILAETAHAYRPFWFDGEMHADGAPPYSQEGQREYLAGALAVLREAPNTTGLYWWGATFINDALEHCEDCFRAQALFDASGAAMPALEAFKIGLE
jgi:arabinogalactan endo-1,4-beta-galactosidase